MVSFESTLHFARHVMLAHVRLQVGWPPPLTGAGSATALVEGTTSGAAEPVGPFEGTDDATLAEVQHIIYDMASLQRSADPDSFAQVPPAALVFSCIPQLGSF